MRRVSALVLATSLAGALVALTGAAIDGSLARSPALVAIAPALGAVVCAPLGLLAALLRASLLRRPRRETRVTSPLAAALIAAGVACWVILEAVPHLAVAFDFVQNQSLAEALLRLGMGALLAAAGASFLLVRTVLARLLPRLEAHVARPPFTWPTVRRAVWMAAPIAIAAIVADVAERAAGPLAMPLWIVPAVALAWAIFPAIEAFSARRPRASRGAALALPAACALLAHGMLQGNAQRVAALGPRGPHIAALTALQRASDVDRDGAPALFGGRDCAPLDPRIGPAEADLPGDGVDADCSGADASAEKADRPRHHEALGAEQRGAFDVVWFIIDAVRADHASVTGYEKTTTPALEVLAKESLVFERAYAQSSATMLSVPSMLTGKDPLAMTWEERQKKAQMAESHTTMAERLRAAGYHTGIVTSPYFKSHLAGALQGYDVVQYFSSDQRKSSPGAASLAITFIEEARRKEPRKPFFLTVYLPAPHAPYVTHPDGGYPGFGTDDAGRYDGEIAAADRHAGFVLDDLRRRPGEWSRTVVVVVADHGEELGEHGGSEHARTCHVESVRVPLLLRAPNIAAARVDAPVALVDVVPALVDVLGIDRPRAGELDGRSLLLTALAPPDDAAARPITCAVVGQDATQGRFFRRSMRMGRHALLDEPTGSSALALYDVEADPEEQHPLQATGEHAKAAEALGALLEARSTGNLSRVDLTDGE